MTANKDEEFVSFSEAAETLEKVDKAQLEAIRIEKFAKCTYSDGYLPRQNLFTCLTCFSQTGKYAALCYDCGLKCHEDHDIRFLDSKRYYRCDCGNGRFDALTVCKIQPNKEFENTYNVYNHNFEEKYCFCNQDYDEEVDEMIECSICEDWFHFKHIGINIEDVTEDDDLACLGCWSKKKAIDLLYKISKKLDSVEKICFKEIDSSQSENNGQSVASAFLINQSFRAKLCRCDHCKELLKAEKLLFLYDKEDIDHSYDSEEHDKILEKVYVNEMDEFINNARKENIDPVKALEKVDDLSAKFVKYMEENCKNREIRRQDVVDFFKILDENNKSS